MILIYLRLEKAVKLQSTLTRMQLVEKLSYVNFYILPNYKRSEQVGHIQGWT
jgi:hypothetical protein